MGNIFLLEMNITVSSEQLQLNSFSFHYNSIIYRVSVFTDTVYRHFKMKVMFER